MLLHRHISVVDRTVYFRGVLDTMVIDLVDELLELGPYGKAKLELFLVATGVSSSL